MKRVVDLGPRCCRWPIREDADGWWLCAAPLAREGLPYCRNHMATAYAKPKLKQTQGERMALIKIAIARRARCAMADDYPHDEQASVGGERLGPFPQVVEANPDQPALGSEENEPAPVQMPAELAFQHHPGANTFARESNDMAADQGVIAPTSAPTPSDGVALTAPDGAPGGGGEIAPRELRLVEAICLDGETPKEIPTEAPVFMDVDPASLLIEETYQRDLSPKSLDLIRRIALAWDWRRFRPPVVVMSDDGGLILDGQHTAIAAASRGLQTIPVQLVDAPAIAERAAAFVGLNKDRLALTPMQIHHAAVAAGDVEAIAIEGMCQRAGVRLVRAMYGGIRWKVGDTYAIGALRGLLARQGVAKSVQMLQVLVQAERAPVSANDIRAVEFLFTDADHAEQLDPVADGGSEAVAAVIRATADTADKDAKVLAASLCVPAWKALAITWFRKTRKRRRAA